MSNFAMDIHDAVQNLRRAQADAERLSKAHDEAQALANKAEQAYCDADLAVRQAEKALVALAKSR